VGVDERWNVMTAASDQGAELFAQAVGLQQAGKLPEARAAYERLIAQGGANAGIFHNHGFVLHHMGDLAGAVAGYERALALKPDLLPALAYRAEALQGLGRFEEAAAGYERAIALDGKTARLHGNPAAVLHELGRHAEALASYDKAVALRPTDAETYNNRGVVAQAAGQLEAAEADYLKAATLQPEYRDARKNALWLAIGGLGDMELIEARLKDAAALVIRQECADLLGHKMMLNFHLQHDLEQTAYLLKHGYVVDGLREAHDAFSTAFERRTGDDAAVNVITLTDAEVAAVNRFRDTLLRPAPPAPMAHYLHPETDWRRIEEQYLDGKPEIVAIDNFLSLEALVAIRTFCLAATVYKTDYAKQYLGAFVEGGFVSPLHIAIARDLQKKMPRIFAGRRLEQMWSFKYTAKMRAGLNIHADFARVNLNFWVTPDEAVIDNTTGGLVVHDVPAPSTWGFRDYNNSDDARIYGFLKSQNASAHRVPYRCNRAVLFNSNLFHETDAIHFKEGYENRRVNITYLFGRGLRI